MRGGDGPQGGSSPTDVSGGISAYSNNKIQLKEFVSVSEWLSEGRGVMGEKGKGE